MKTVFIYTLNCPTTGQVRYVGKTDNLRRRYQVHLKAKDECRRTNWIHSLASRGLRPKLELLDEVLDIEWQAAECAYIQFFREQGLDLVNGTDGGDGSSGWPHSSETKKKISQANKGKPKSPEHRAKCSAWQVGRKLPIETREKVSAAGRLRKHSVETRAKMSLAQSGEKNAMFGRKASEETRRKRSVASREMWRKRRENTKD